MQPSAAAPADTRAAAAPVATLAPALSGALTNAIITAGLRRPAANQLLFRLSAHRIDAAEAAALLAPGALAVYDHELHQRHREARATQAAIEDQGAALSPAAMTGAARLRDFHSYRIRRERQYGTGPVLRVPPQATPQAERRAYELLAFPATDAFPRR